MTRSIVALLDGSTADMLVIEGVKRVMARGSATVEVLPIINPDMMVRRQAVPAGAMAFKMQADKARQRSTEAAVRQSVMWAQEHVTWMEGVTLHPPIKDDPRAVLEERYGDRDLLLLGRDAPGVGTRALSTDDLLALLSSGHSPTLVLTGEDPDHHDETTPIAIAFDGSEQAIDSLTDFLDLGIGGKTPLEIVCLDKDPAVAETIAQQGAELCRSMGRSATAHAARTSQGWHPWRSVKAFFGRHKPSFSRRKPSALARKLLSHDGHGYFCVLNDELLKPLVENSSHPRSDSQS